jgi:hypothetical protein
VQTNMQYKKEFDKYKKSLFKVEHKIRRKENDEDLG